MNRHTQSLVWSSLAAIVFVCASQSPPKSDSAPSAPSPETIHVERVSWLNHDVWFDDQVTHTIGDASKVKDGTAVHIKLGASDDSKLDVDITAMWVSGVPHPLEDGLELLVHFEFSPDAKLHATLGAKWRRDFGSRPNVGDVTNLRGDVYWSIHKGNANIRVFAIGDAEAGSTPIAAGFVINADSAPAFVARLASLPKPSSGR